MKKKRSWTWTLAASLGAMGVVVLGTGTYYAIAGPKDLPSAFTYNTPQQQTAQQPTATPAAAPAAKSGTYTITALGDSLTKGVGDATGKGYVGDLQDLLDQNGQHVALQNLGISGLESPELVRSVQSPGIQALLKQSQLVLISIGGNDLTNAAGDIQQLLETRQIDTAKVQTAQAQYTKNLQQILKSVRQANPQAPIYVIGLYNPFEGMLDDQTADRILLAWNDNVAQTAEQFANVKVVPTFDLFQWNNDQLLSSDHFHPNQAGYQKIAARIFATLPEKIQSKSQ